MNPDHRFSMASMPHALRTGLDFLRDPPATWARVQRSPANVREVLQGYVLWWILALALVGWVVQLGLDVYNEGVPLPKQMLMGLGSALLAGFSALGAMLGMAAAVVLMVHKNRHSQVRWPDALRLAAYGMTPVWLALMLSGVPEVGGWALLAGVGYGLYGVRQVLGQLAWLPADKRESFMLGLTVAALVVTVLYSALGVLIVVVGFLALVLKFNTKFEQKDAQAEPVATHKEGLRDRVPEQADANHFDADPPPSLATPAARIDSAKINALDKKIDAATAQGDMAEVVRLMGEKNMALQGIATAQSKVGEF